MIESLQKKNRLFSTCLGFGGLLLWGFYALMAVKLKNLPVYEYLAIILGSSFLFTALKLTKKREWKIVFQHKSLCLVGGFLILLVEFFYFSAFRNAPAAQVDMINYLWPILILVGISSLPGEKFSLLHLFSSFLGFFAIFLLFGFGKEQQILPSYYLGYTYAFGSACSWALFNVFGKSFPKLSSDLIGIYSGIAAAFFTLMHLTLETFVMPTFQEGSLLLFTGIGPTALAFWMWDQGIKKGNYQVLSLLSYTTPFISIAILALFGEIELTPILGLSCSLLIFASSFPSLFQWIQKKRKTISSPLPLLENKINALSKKKEAFFAKSEKKLKDKKTLNHPSSLAVFK